MKLTKSFTVRNNLNRFWKGIEFDNDLSNERHLSYWDERVY